MRLRKVKNIEEKILQYSNIIMLDPSKHKGAWHKLFGNHNPIYLEIGTGKGQFIMNNAIKYPGINFIGCEISDSVIYKAAKKISDKEIKNLFLINVDALKLNEIFEKSEVEKIFLNFSDPWPKSRHEKRRLTSETFLNVYKQILIDNGFVEFKTDNRKLFEYSIMKFNELKHEILELSLDLHSDNTDIITTEYEDKFTSLGQVIYYTKVRLK